MTYSAQSAEQDSPVSYAIVLHGGAGSNPDQWSDQQRKARSASLEKALNIGVEILKSGGSSLDAVEEVIRFMEDDPVFNAGRGAVFNAAGGHELDASIMDGRTRACGAVAAVKTVKNPISLARKVMVETKHVLLAADGAEEFADHAGVDLVDNAYFSTDAMRKQLHDAQERARKSQPDTSQERGTVGCVAFDQHGNIAAGTSTGGRNNKMFGRVGDSPIVGAGTYADNKTCGVSGTGVGEEYIRHAAAYDVSARMAYQQKSVSEAVRIVIEETLRPGDGGMIAVSHTGEITAQFNTPGMSHAAADSKGTRWIKLK